MSLNRALGEMFKAIREEAARNPEFAAKIGEAIAIYKPPKRRRPAAPIAPAPPPAPFDLSTSLARGEAAADEPVAADPAPAPALNPIAVLGRDGADALRQELASDDYSAEALTALIAEHNLDPSGAAVGADKAGLIDQIVIHAAKRVERDKALFNY